MRAAGMVVAEAHEVAARLVRPGVTTREIDSAVAEVFRRHGAVPLFLGFPGKVPFPAVTCTSLNEQVVHGIPGETALNPHRIARWLPVFARFALPPATHIRL